MPHHATPDSLTTTGRVLVVAPSWVGDAILSEPLVARVKAARPEVRIDVLAPAWCAPVYARMQGVGRIFDTSLRHGRVDWARRKALARTLGTERYAQAIVLPNSWKSALVPWLARIPRRTGYLGEMRWGIVNDLRRLDRNALPRLVERYAALAGSAGEAAAAATAPILVPDPVNRDAAVHALHLRVDGGIAILCPGAEFGPAKRWPPVHFAELAHKFLADGHEVWVLGSPNDKTATEAVLAACGDARGVIRDLCRAHGPGYRDRLAVAGLDRRQQRFRTDARRGGRWRSAGRAVRVVVPGLYAADVGHGEDRAHRHRLQPLLQARVPARTLQVHARSRPAGGV